MNESTHIRVGDRVIIRTAYYNRHRHLDNREGTVVRIEGEYVGRPLYHVEVQGWGYGEIPTMSVVLAEPEITVGDRVIIREGFNHGRLSSVVGRTGTVQSITLDNGRTKYAVDGCYAARVEKLAPAERLADRAAEKIPAADLADIALPPANLQAATFAHQLLGPDADLDKLIGVAEFAMDRRSSGAVISGDVIVNVTSEVPSTKTPRPADLVLRDQDGDEIHLSVVHKAWEVLVEAPGELGANLTGANLDAAIQFLTAARDYHRQA